MNMYIVFIIHPNMKRTWEPSFTKLKGSRYGEVHFFVFSLYFYILSLNAMGGIFTSLSLTPSPMFAQNIPLSLNHATV